MCAEAQSTAFPVEMLPVARRTSPSTTQKVLFWLRRMDRCAVRSSPRPPRLRVKLQFTKATAAHAETRRTRRWAERSLRRSRKDFEVVDGRERCPGGKIATRKAVLCPSSVRLSALRVASLPCPDVAHPSASNRSNAGCPRSGAHDASSRRSVRGMNSPPGSRRASESRATASSRRPARRST